MQITGRGVISCAGDTPEKVWNNLISETSCVSGGLGRISSVYEKIDKNDRAFSLAMQAAQVAMQDAGWQSLGPRDGLILATTTGQILSWDSAWLGYLTKTLSQNDFEIAFQNQHLGRLNDRLANSLGSTHHRWTITSACTAATQAIALANTWIKQNKVDRCLVGSVEVLCDLTVEGFRSLQLLSTKQSKPFDAHRDGINLSEAAAFLCIEKGSQAQKSYAKILGVGLTTDAYNMTSPEPSGLGSAQAMNLAIKNARISQQEISWIHAHGTGSPHNDIAEGSAISRVFGQNVPPVTSTKSIHGHALAASGLLETIICLEAFAKQVILKTSFLETPDPGLKFNFINQHQEKKIYYILKNTLGFGGANASLLLAHPKLETL